MGGVLPGHFTQVGYIFQKIIPLRINCVVRTKCGNHAFGPWCASDGTMMGEIVYCTLGSGDQFYVKSIQQGAGAVGVCLQLRIDMFVICICCGG